MRDRQRGTLKRVRRDCYSTRGKQGKESQQERDVVLIERPRNVPQQLLQLNPPLILSSLPPPTTCNFLPVSPPPPTNFVFASIATLPNTR